MKFWLGITYNDWFRYLSEITPDDVNFWQPGGKTAFKVLKPGEPFLFKLKRPFNAIAGVGFFSKHTFLPLSMAWEIFGNKNGFNSFEEFKRTILKIRGDYENVNPQIGCIVLSSPVFFRKEDWIKVPDNWASGIQRGKSYNTQDSTDDLVWQEVQKMLEKYPFMNQTPEKTNQLILEEDGPRYGNPVWTKVRIGQSAFRVMVTDSYSRRCAISGEKTLPVLEAAHIKPYALSGPHTISNGLLLRSDMHKLFDGGYITITSELKVEVSKRIKEEFENGREYYQYHGKSLLYLPQLERDRPANQFVDWHNNEVYRS